MLSDALSVQSAISNKLHLQLSPWKIGSEILHYKGLIE